MNIHIWQDGGYEGPAAVFAFWPTLTYFYHCDTHLSIAAAFGMYRGRSLADDCSVSIVPLQLQRESIRLTVLPL